MSCRLAGVLPAVALAVASGGCSSADPVDEKPTAQLPVSVMAIQATPASQARTGINTWQLYDHNDGGYSVLARAADGEVVKAMGFRVISSTTTKSVRIDYGNDAVLVVDGEGRVVKNTMTVEHAALNKELHEALQANAMPYGCWGDILWAIGGLIVTIPVCAATIPGAATGPADSFVVMACVGTVIGGPIAGTFSAIEDCSSGQHHEITVQTSFESYWNPTRSCWMRFGTNACIG